MVEIVIYHGLASSSEQSIEVLLECHMSTAPATDVQTDSKKTVTVVYYAALTDFTSIRSQVLNIPMNLTTKMFIPYLIQHQFRLQGPAARKVLDTCACAINLEYVDLGIDDEVIEDGAEIVLIPPVSGG